MYNFAVLVRRVLVSLGNVKKLIKEPGVYYKKCIIKSNIVQMLTVAFGESTSMWYNGFTESRDVDNTGCPRRTSTPTTDKKVEVIRETVTKNR